MRFRTCSRVAALTALAASLGAAACRDAAERSQPAPAPAVSPAALRPPRPAPPPARATPPSGFVEVTVGGVAPIAHSNAVLLVDVSRRRAVPIFIGDTEALTIQLRLEHKRYARPLTHDLLDAMLKKLGGRVESVRVDKLDRDVFHGKVVLRDGARRTELDARSSDAVAVALGHEVPIFMERTVLERAGIALENGLLPRAKEPEDTLPAAPSARREAVSL